MTVRFDILHGEGGRFFPSDGFMEEGENYYPEDGNMVFTEKFLLKRGHCCESGCRHCPYQEQESRNPEEG
jgi:hypothetical protein